MNWWNEFFHIESLFVIAALFLIFCLAYLTWENGVMQKELRLLKWESNHFKERIRGIVSNLANAINSNEPFNMYEEIESTIKDLHELLVDKEKL